MTANLDKSALFEAQDAYWNVEGGTDKGIEAAIVAYLDRMGLSETNNAVISARVTFQAQMVSLMARINAAGAA
jgi:hypothetical protein